MSEREKKLSQNQAEKSKLYHRIELELVTQKHTNRIPSSVSFCSLFLLFCTLLAPSAAICEQKKSKEIYGKNPYESKKREAAKKDMKELPQKTTSKKTRKRKYILFFHNSAGICISAISAFIRKWTAAVLFFACHFALSQSCLLMVDRVFILFLFSCCMDISFRARLWKERFYYAVHIYVYEYCYERAHKAKKRRHNSNIYMDIKCDPRTHSLLSTT